MENQSINLLTYFGNSHKCPLIQGLVFYKCIYIKHGHETWHIQLIYWTYEIGVNSCKLVPRIFNCAVVIICSLKEKAEFIRHQHYCLVFASLNCWRLRLTIDAQFTTEGVWNGPPRNGLIKIRWWHRAAGPNCLLTWQVSECTVLVFLDFLIRNF